MSTGSTFAGFSLGDVHGQVDESPGLVQAHGLVLVVREPLLRIVQASTSAAAILHRPLDTLLLATLHDLGGDLDAQVRAHVRLEDEQPALAQDKRFARALRCRLGGSDAGLTPLEGLIYRIDNDALLIELEPLASSLSGSELLQGLGVAVQSISEAATIEALCDCAARWVLKLAAYERATVHALQANGELRVVAQADSQAPAGWPHARPAPAPTLPPHLAHQPPCSRVHAQMDTRQAPSELLPLVLHGSTSAAFGSVDLSRGNLSSLAPRQLQVLREQGVAARASVSLLHDGRPWGWMVCDHSQPHHLSARARAALELLAEAVGTRIAALEHHARSRVAQQLRGLEQRLVEATSLEGDWRQALVRDPRLLLQPLQASGAVLFQRDETFCCGTVPEPRELRQLLRWVTRQSGPGPLQCSWLQDQDPTLAALTPVAARVLAVRLSAASPDWLLWLRGACTEAADSSEDASGPAAAPTPSPDWSRIDAGTAAGFARALAGISVQVDAVRMLIAEAQLAELRDAITGSPQAVVVFGAAMPGCQGNDAFFTLAGREPAQGLTQDKLAALFTDRDAIGRVVAQVRGEQRPWRGELTLLRGNGIPMPVAVRVEPVPAHDAGLLGLILLIEDLSASLQAETARQRLEASLMRTERGLRGAGHPELVGALLVNAGIAAMDISDDGLAETTATLLEQVEASTQRAAELFRRIRSGD